LDGGISKEFMSTRKRPNTARDPKSYEVGYGKPPTRSQFRKGQSGNLSGRPKSASRLDSVLKTELDADVSLAIDGKSREISRREAIVRRVFAAALGGDIRALEIFIRHTRKREAEDPRPGYIIKYFRSSVGKSLADDRGNESNGTAGSSSSVDGTLTTARALAGLDEPRGEPPAAIEEPAAGIKESTADFNECGAAKETVRMRATKPYSHHYLTGQDGKAAWYASNADAIIENVRPEDLRGLLAQGCVRI
jgi:hypothetical protein